MFTEWLNIRLPQSTRELDKTVRKQTILHITKAINK